METLAEAASRLLDSAQAGSAGDAARDAVELLAHEPTPSIARAAMEYALAVASLTLNDLPATEAAATTCTMTAEAAGSPDWRANALAIRAYARILGAHVDSAIADLVDAEIALPNCADVSLRGSAHTGIGNCYAELRMYELALPHMALAYQIREPATRDEVPRFVGPVNLAETHLRWAEELERLGLDEPDRLAEHDRHIADAAHWVDRLVVDERWHGSSWEPVIGRLISELLSYRDPASSIPPLRAARASFAPEKWMEQFLLTTAALSRALRVTGQPAEALALAREGTAVLVPGLEWTLAMAVHHQAHLAALDLGLPGAVDAAAYLHLTLTSNWAQRVRAVQGASGLLQQARLQWEVSESSRLAREDPLTGLANRRAYEEAVLAASDSPMGLILVDVDRFKAVNDEFGHAVGDGVLIRVGEILRATSRSMDLVARFGGDEMVILVHGDSSTVDAVAARVTTALTEFPADDLAPGLRVSASVGWSSLIENDTPQSLLRRADAHMYRAKRHRYR